MPTDKEVSAKEMARNMVGDGKRPNKYFVTIAYGYYFPIGEDDDMIQAANSLESSTFFFNNKQEAEEFFDSIPMPTNRKEITGKTISQIMIEDRLTGVVKDRFYKELRPSYFIRQTY